MAIRTQHSIGTLRLKVKAEGYAWLNKAAIEVNDVWNFASPAPIAQRALGAPLRYSKVLRAESLS
jgi:hypothetical protein